MSGGAAGALAMFFIIAVILYRLAPSSVRNAGKGLWFIGGVSANVFLFLFAPVKNFLIELFVDYRQPYPYLTIPGWCLVGTLVISTISGATLVKRYTEDASVQEGLAWTVRVFGFGLIITGIQNAYIGVGLVVLLLLPHVFPRFVWVPIYGVCFGPFFVVWWIVAGIFGLMFGWEVSDPDEIFYSGGFLADYTPAAPAPLQRSRKYLTGREMAAEAEINTAQHLKQMCDDVASGNVVTEEWTVSGGRFVKTPVKKKRDDVHHLTPVAQQRLKRELYARDGNDHIDD